MGTVIIVGILAVIVLLAVLSVRKRIKYGSACCGTRDAAPKKIKVKDKNTSHYPYTYKLTVDGMHCGNCACRVENALNSKEGIWASVNLGNKSVLVRAKEAVEEAEFFSTIDKAGYTMIGFEKAQ